MGFERSDSGVAVLGMDGFVLLAAVEVDGELHQLVETEASIVVGRRRETPARTRSTGQTWRT